MKDDGDRYFETALKTLFPSFASGKWPELTFAHRQTLAASCNECTTLMRAAEHAFRKVEDDADLTLEAKLRKRAELGEEYLAKIETSKTLAKATEAANAMLQKYQAKIDAPLALQEEDPRQIAVHVQIRDRLHGMKPEQQIPFLEKHCDAATIRAVLTAPRWLSGLSDIAYKFVQLQLEKRAPPEVIAERQFVTDALAEVTLGFKAARTRLQKRANEPISPLSRKPAPQPKKVA